MKLVVYYPLDYRNVIDTVLPEAREELFGTWKVSISVYTVKEDDSEIALVLNYDNYENPANEPFEASLALDMVQSYIAGALTYKERKERENV